MSEHHEKQFESDGWKRRYADVPVLSLDEMFALPEPQENYDSGVYFLWRGRELLYVGKSLMLWNRMVYQTGVNRTFAFAISKTAKFIPFDKMTCLVLNSDFEKPPAIQGMLSAYERRYLAEYQPGFNMDQQSGFT